MTKLLKSVLALSVAAIVSGLFPMSALAGTAFDEKFADKTLRVDYIFSGDAREFDTLKSKIFDRVRSELFFLSNLFSIFVVYISKYRKYETFN